jgi:hypothetical protein
MLPFLAFFCLFMLFVSFLAAWAIFQLSGGCHHYRWLGCKFGPMLSAQGLWAGRDLYRATPTATRDLGLYGLIWKTGTHVPQWDSNPRRKDHQIFAPDALTTAPRVLPRAILQCNIRKLILYQTNYISNLVLLIYFTICFLLHVVRKR